MLVAVDVDGVLADLHKEWLHRYNRDYNDTLGIDAITAWDIQQFVKPECGRRIFDYLRDSDLYERVKPIEGALEGVAALRDLGHRPIFATSCVKGMADQKWEWLERHYFLPRGPRVQEDLVMITDKNLLNADVLIDDRADTIERWTKMTRRPAMLFNAPYNHHLKYGWRVFDWVDVVRFIRKLTEPRQSELL